MSAVQNDAAMQPVTLPALPSAADALAWALDLAAEGYCAFPCKGDKKPTTDNGFKDASTDPDIIRGLWASRPGPLVGIATGAVSALAVLDIDSYKPGGAAWFAQHGSRLPVTYTVETRSGGRHFYFRQRAGLRCSTGKIADGIDVRAEGGYVIFWPAAGCRVLADVDLAPWPAWLDDMLGEAAHASAPGGTEAPPTPDALKAIDPAALAAIARELPNDARFDDRTEWVRLAHALAAAFADDPALAEELWLEHAAKREQKAGEAERVWTSLPTPHRAGAEYIVKKAREAGVDVSRYDAARAGAAFAAVPLPVDAAGGPGEPPPGAVAGAPALPLLIVHPHDRPATVRALRAVLAKAPDLFNRGDMPVMLTRPANGGPPIAKLLTYNSVVYAAHDHCQPVKVNAKGDLTPLTLPDAVARMFLDLGDRGLRPLAGISTAPLLTTDGAILAAAGYDRERALWCEPTCDLAVPDRPAHANAEAALAKLRDAFRTFPFADAVRVQDGDMLVIDATAPPGTAESSFLCALLTAVCRPSLWLAPGLLIVAPEVSGAGSGKGLLARALCLIAFGCQPAAFVGGHDRQELDKRLVSALIEAAPAVFLDNVNSTALRSDTLSSVLTERPAHVRIMGESRMVPLNCTVFVVITGNGLSVSEDLARRFLTADLDPRCEDPESRPFKPGFLQIIRERRPELLAACLTIWRWGRQNAGSLARGLPLGSFETWAEWVRDPLLTLGCTDPVERVRQAKANDPRRQNVAALFAAWWQHHGERPMAAADLHDAVLAFINPQNRPRQYVATLLLRMTGTRAAGFVLTRQPPAGKWTAATYALALADPAPLSDGIGHRRHRTHRCEGISEAGAAGPAAPPMPPMSPMPYVVQEADHGAFAAPSGSGAPAGRFG